MRAKKRIPVILDTDIGGDIDDTWALAMMLRCPELDVKLVVSDHGDTVYRAKIIARMLEVAGRTEVDVGVGIPQPLAIQHKRQSGWVNDYRLEKYPGRVHDDGVGAIIRTIMQSKDAVTLICIGPVPNIGEALDREPLIARNARFVGMHGSIDWSHQDGNKPIAEYNVKTDVQACRKALTAPWDKTITPLDTCGKVRLTAQKYRAVAESRDPLAKAVIENYRVWQQQGGWVKESDRSSILFDCVAVYLAFSTELLRMERMGVRVTDEGFTVADSDAPEVNCAVAWKDLGKFEDFIVERLSQ